jgi:hypothetical protein
MTCKHCGASISENEEKCPYCDSYIDHPARNSSYNNGYPQNRQGFRVQGPDEPQAMFIVISLMIPLLGIILGVINISGGHPKSGKLYIILGAASMIFLFGCTFLFPMMFALIPFAHMK